MRLRHLRLLPTMETLLLPEQRLLAQQAITATIMVKTRIKALRRLIGSYFLAVSAFISPKQLYFVFDMADCFLKQVC